MTLQVVWFKRDMRVEDHEPLSEAARRGPTLPLYVAEPGLWARTGASARQWAFVAESLAGLRAALARLGQPLVVRCGNVVTVLDEIRRRHGIAALWSHQETGNAWTYARDRRVADWARRNGVPWIERAQYGVVRGLKSRDVWAARWERMMAAGQVPVPRGLAPLPGIDAGALPGTAALGLSPDPCPDRQAGGREAGLDLLGSFLADRGAAITARFPPAP